MKYKAKQITYITGSVKGIHPDKDVVKAPKTNYYIRACIKGQTLYYDENGEWAEFNSAAKFTQKQALQILIRIKKRYKSADLFSSTV